MGSPSLIKISSNHGSVITEVLVAKLLQEVCRFVEHNLSPDDLAAYAKRITQQWFHWRLEDLSLCLNRGIEGRYRNEQGKIIYGKWNYMVFVEWANFYEDERQVAIEQFRAVEHLDVKNRPFQISQAAVEIIKQNGVAKKMIENSAMPVEKTMWDLQIERFSAQFVRLPNYKYNKPKMVSRYGRIMDYTEFIKYKAKQFERIVKILGL